jgi:hypothetical protein
VWKTPDEADDTRRQAQSGEDVPAPPVDGVPENDFTPWSVQANGIWHPLQVTYPAHSMVKAARATRAQEAPASRPSPLTPESDSAAPRALVTTPATHKDDSATTKAVISAAAPDAATGGIDESESGSEPDTEGNLVLRFWVESSNYEMEVGGFTRYNLEEKALRVNLQTGLCQCETVNITTATRDFLGIPMVFVG